MNNANSLAPSVQDSSVESSPQFQTISQDDPALPAPLSKNAIKKAKKAEKYAAVKLERRAREKERRKEKKLLKAQDRERDGHLEDEDEVDKEGKRRGEKRARRDGEVKGKPVAFGARVIVDLGFDELMSENEIKSLTSQLAYTYSANRRASFPFSLLFTSLNGRTLTRLDTVGDAQYRRWANTEWWEDGYEELWSKLSSESQNDPRDKRENTVYLTADSEEELLELNPHETYIIGGIVDRNRYKNICQTKSTTTHVRSARLPIGRYLADMPTRKVLTVNQVFEIMLKWVETRDWEKALYAVVPKRKFQGRLGTEKVGSEGMADDCEEAENETKHSLKENEISQSDSGKSS